MAFMLIRVNSNKPKRKKKIYVNYKVLEWYGTLARLL